MKKQRKKYEKPVRPWDKTRIEKEKEIIKTYGLKNKREIWKNEDFLRKYRRLARQLAAKKNKEMEKILVEKLFNLGLLTKNASLDDVLDLTLPNILDRRLQTIVFKKGLAKSIKQARQFITHGHIKIDGKRIVYPSYLVSINEEERIQVDLPVLTKGNEV